MLRKAICCAAACATLGVVGLAGCAKSPSMPGASVGTQIVVSMTVRGVIRPDYFYYVLFNNSADASGTSGPVPVVAPPYGNGFAAGTFTQFVVVNGAQSSGYGVYAVKPGSNLRSFTPLPSPVQTATGTSTIQFRIPLSELATPSVPAASIRYLQINFVNTNTVPVDPNYTGLKLFDALGDSTQPGGINDYISIDVSKAATYQNSDKGLEGPNDVVQVGNGTFQVVNEPDLDIVDWRVQVVD
jgi:hypothetical protein